MSKVYVTIKKCCACGESFKIRGNCSTRCGVCQEATEKLKQKEYRDKNKEKRHAYMVEWLKENKESQRVRRAKTYRENTELFRDRCKRSSQTLNFRFNISVRGAARREKEWSLSFEQYSLLMENNCSYCDGQLSGTSTGLDRKDHRLGYTEGNVTPCCKRCNFKKGQLEGAGFVYPRTVELLLELLKTG